MASRSRRLPGADSNLPSRATSRLLTSRALLHLRHSGIPSAFSQEAGQVRMNYVRQLRRATPSAGIVCISTASRRPAHWTGASILTKGPWIHTIRLLAFGFGTPRLQANPVLAKRRAALGRGHRVTIRIDIGIGRRLTSASRAYGRSSQRDKLATSGVQGRPPVHSGVFVTGGDHRLSQYRISPQTGTFGFHCWRRRVPEHH